LHKSSAVSSSAGVVTIDLNQPKEKYILTLTENVGTWNFVNYPVAAGTYARIRLAIVQHASAAKTVVSPAPGKTAGGAWTASATLSSKQWLDLEFDSSGIVGMIPYGVFS
jgi:hypothetical protein